MGEHKVGGNIWKRNNARSSNDGHAIKWGPIFKRARGTEGLWFPLENGIARQKALGTKGIRKMAERAVWENMRSGSKTWKRNNYRSSHDGHTIKWGRIVKRKQGDEANKWDRIFKRDAEAESEEVSEMVAKGAEEREEDDNSSLYYYEEE